MNIFGIFFYLLLNIFGIIFSSLFRKKFLFKFALYAECIMKHLYMVSVFTLNSCFISHSIKPKLDFKQRMDCNNQRRYSII
jgi:hypothetical protein